MFEEVDRDLVQRVGAAAAEAATPWERFTVSWNAFLDDCVRAPDVRRTLFVDAPAVLGWAEYRELDNRHALGAVAAALKDLMDADLLDRRPVEPLAQILLGVLNEAGLFVADAADPDEVRGEIGATLAWMFERLRK